MSVALEGLLRAAEEELRRAQRQATRIGSRWPVPPEHERSTRLVQRALRLIAAVEKRKDGGVTRSELQAGWEELARIQKAITALEARFGAGV